MMVPTTKAAITQDVPYLLSLPARYSDTGGTPDLETSQLLRSNLKRAVRE